MRLMLESIADCLIPGFFHLLGRVSPHRARRLSGMAGRLWFVMDRRHREVALQNLALAFGDKSNHGEIRSLARKVFCHLALLLFEIGRLSLGVDKGFDRRFRFYGLHHLVSAYKKGRGLLVLTGHVGSWEMMAYAAALLGYPMSGIYRPLDYKPLDRFFIQLRGQYGARLIAKKSAMRPVLRGLEQQELVAVLLDQNASATAGVFVDFFGRPACTSKGLSLLALGTATPVIPLFVMREGECFHVAFGPEIPVVRTGDKERDMEANTRLYNRVIEDVIRRYPEQWFWVHRRWKTRPGRKIGPLTQERFS